MFAFVCILTLICILFVCVRVRMYVYLYVLRVWHGIIAKTEAFCPQKRWKQRMTGKKSPPPAPEVQRLRGKEKCVHAMKSATYVSHLISFSVSSFGSFPVEHE